MSKKELVKNIIDELIVQGKDFHEITQGTLVQVKGLENISKTTIKRAKNEYKKEKIVVKSNYKETLIKRKIYKYLDRYPKTTLSDLREALPEIPPAKISEYYLYWTRKREKAKTHKVQKRVIVNPRKLKEMVFNYLNNSEEATCEDLFKAFPEANRSSVTSYFGHWKKKRTHHEKGKEGSLYHVIFRFLDSHPDSTIDTLHQSFADVPKRSLEVYLNLWQKKQGEAQENQAESDINDLEKNKLKHERVKRVKQAKAKTSEKHSAVEHPFGGLQTLKRRKQKTVKKPETVEFSSISPLENKQIRELKQKIEEQKLTLTALEVENSLLKDNFQSNLIEGFESMTHSELKDVKEFIKTYVKGMETE
jgi:hypothetical protein